MPSCWRTRRRSTPTSGRTDLVSRIGGDEFVIVADPISSSAAAALAQRLRGVVITAGESGTAAAVTMSVGAAIIDGTTDSTALVVEADAAMYRDKHDHS